MARLPTVGGDNGNWGTVLNDYLSVSLDTDGSIKPAAIPSGTYAKLSGGNTISGDQRFTGRVGIGTDNPRARVPFITSQVMPSSASGTEDFVANLIQSIYTGDFTGVTSTNPGYGWGVNIFTTTGTSANDGNGMTNLQNLIETSIKAPSGTITQAIGLMVEAAFIGSTAGSQVNTMASLRVATPKRKDGATGGTATTIYGLFLEGTTLGDLGSTTAYTLYAQSGKSYFGGPVEVTLADATAIGLRIKMAGTPTANPFEIHDVFGTRYARITNSGLLIVNNRIVSMEGLSSQVTVGNVGPSGVAAISFGSASDTTIYRSGAGVLGLVDGHNILVGTTTGTQIATQATQKLGFFGATPVVRQTLPSSGTVTAADIRTALLALGLCV